MSHLKNKTHYALLLLPASIMLWGIGSVPSTAQYESRTRTDEQPALLTLQSSRGVIETRSPISTITTSEDGQVLYTVDGLTGEVDAYSSRPDGTLLHVGKTLGAVKGPHGYSVSTDKGQKITVWDAAGQIAANIKTYPADSLTFLSNGNLLVASPANGHLLHVYNQQGQLLRSFGTFKEFNRDEGENQFLHRGKVLADAADNIYYVYRYVPLIQKYAPDGTLLSEIKVTGAAIDVQQEVAERFFSHRRAEQVGGLHILTAAALDYRTGHLWIGMNGSTITGVIYEYDAQGEKLREYALEAVSPFFNQRIIGVSDIAITDSALHVLTNLHQVHSFSRFIGWPAPARRPNLSPQLETLTFLNAASTRPIIGLAAVVQSSCGTSQPWDSCSFNCPGPVCNGSTPTATSSTGVPLDCKAALQASLTGSYTVIRSSCSQFNPGTAMHMRGGCTSSVTICIDGTNTDHSITLECPTPTCPTPTPTPTPTPGDGGSCIPQDCSTDNGHINGYWDWSTCACEYSPILIDVAGNGFALTNAQNGVNFDLNADGTRERLAWTTANSDDAWLVLDRNGNGLIDNGTELFGDITPQPPSTTPNGFLALAEYDKPQQGGNGDGLIDSRDAIFASLRLWQDANHDGISQPEELHTLPTLGVMRIDLSYKEARRTDEYGNQFRYRTKVSDAQGAQVGRWAWDVFLVSVR